ncbi:MAG: LpqB family beta-propeller domain-containing protein [Propionibacteriaceae bacterium]|jgi:hypothetical protein|nr:LpqB family beta-propeller domain-containing protein [Propionibacteriaceae bacterium]
MSRKRWLPGLLAASLCLSACGTIGVPESGEVQFHPMSSVRPVTEVQVEAMPPAADADPATIVEGFLHAMGVYQNNYAIARLYLTAEASANWMPTSGVKIYQDGALPRVVEDDVLLNAPLEGELDAVGAFRPASGQLRHDFALEQNELGQWRISNPPEGLLVSRYLFDEGWTGVNLYLAKYGSTLLVPELLQLPLGDSLLETTVERLLLHTGGWRGAAREALGLTLVSATTQNGTATLDLGGATLMLTQEDRSHLLAELTLTLTQLNGVTGVTVMANGVPWTIPGHDDLVFRAADFASRDPGARQAQLYVTSSALALAPEDQEMITPVLGVSGQFAVSASTNQVAYLAADAATVYVRDRSATAAAEFTGEAWLRPDFDTLGRLWIAQSSSLASLQTVVGAVAIPAVGEGLPEGTLVAFRVSPEAARVAAVLRGADGFSLGLASLAVTDSQVTLSAWTQIALPLAEGNELLDVGWSGVNELEVLVSNAQADTNVYQVSVDGARITDLGPSSATGLVELACAPGVETVARAATGNVYRLEGEFDWPLLLTGATGIDYGR